MVRARTSEAGPFASAKVANITAGVNSRAGIYMGHPHQSHYHNSQKYGSVQQQMMLNRAANINASHHGTGDSLGGIRGGFDGPITAPWRKTVSIFKQPVTLVHTTSTETKVAPVDELRKANEGRLDKPKQVFWCKQLEGLRPMVPLKVKSEKEKTFKHIADNVALPAKIEPVTSVTSLEASAASFFSSLQQNSSVINGPIIGQIGNRKQIDSNPAVFVTPDQPFVQGYFVQDSDISVQERRVLDARRRLEEARKHFG